MVEGQRTQLFVSEMFSAHANIIHAWKQDVFKRKEKKQQQKKATTLREVQQPARRGQWSELY